MIKRILILTFLTGTMLASTHAQRLVPPAEIPALNHQNHVQQIQSNDSYRVIELEETVRKLNGKVEELNYLLIQLQEKMRK